MASPKIQEGKGEDQDDQKSLPNPNAIRSDLVVGIRPQAGLAKEIPRLVGSGSKTGNQGWILHLLKKQTLTPWPVAGDDPLF
ncbi:MAG: hypothetical protein HQK60_19490 [Deltaproteobacteria bacterium]|nr:hypothetical protein [Deltaproteobacteria bacterium]